MELLVTKVAFDILWMIQAASGNAFSTSQNFIKADTSLHMSTRKTAIRKGTNPYIIRNMDIYKNRILSYIYLKTLSLVSTN